MRVALAVYATVDMELELFLAMVPRADIIAEGGVLPLVNRCTTSHNHMKNCLHNPQPTTTNIKNRLHNHNPHKTNPKPQPKPKTKPKTQPSNPPEHTKDPQPQLKKKTKPLDIAQTYVGNLKKKIYSVSAYLLFLETLYHY